MTTKGIKVPPGEPGGKGVHNVCRSIRVCRNRRLSDCHDKLTNPLSRGARADYRVRQHTVDGVRDGILPLLGCPLKSEF